MCIAWMVFFSNAMIFARYYRKHWPNTKPCGLAMWFQLHRLLNMIGIGLTIASFACIFSSKGWQWSGPRAYQPAELNETWGSIHSMLGLLACVAAWMQPLNAVFRCEHQSSLRIIFNILHRFCGFSAWLMAAASTMIAVRWFSGRFTSPHAALGLFVTYVVVFGVTFIFSEVCLLDTEIAVRSSRSKMQKYHKTSASTMIAVRWFSGRFTSPHAALGLFVTYVVVFGVTFIFSEVLYIRIWWQRKNVVVSSDVEMYPIDEKDSNVILSADEEKRNRLQLVISGVFFVVSSGTCVAICCLMGMVDE
ncbi:Putative ferric-chelate reductase 1 [Toxocara canis]|uniref:ascorbate ferrireductase (transmembrane) n=1 Tax=Toxocara canis TaxID=6265 RepID=A0A0B2V4X6_TOXCA|nr:Putative ferric-chelate reductase 1 [Toxocara canis]